VSGAVRDILGLEVEEVFGPGGPLARALPGYEHRPEQVRMARAVLEAALQRRHLLVEAGTGVGKSLAYLIPLLMWALPEGKRIVVSTYTKTLQEQLTKKDLPFLRDELGIGFSFALYMGSQNYLCLRRLARMAQMGLFEDIDEVREFRAIVEWSLTTKTGLLTELPFEPSPSVWGEVAREPDRCMGKKCPFYGRCFYYEARRKISEADVIVVNHSLFFADLAADRGVLPEYDAVVFDEAHTLEDVATKYFGLELSSSQIRHLLREVYDPGRGRGLLMEVSELVPARADAAKFSSEIRALSEEVFERASRALGEGVAKRLPPRALRSELLRERLANLANFLRELRKLVKGDEETATELRSLAERAKKFADVLQAVDEQPWEDWVYYAEREEGVRAPRIYVKASPIVVADELRKNIFEAVKPVILTSATLTAAGRFDFIRDRLGVEDADELVLGSPFDYEAQALLYIADDLPDPSEDLKGFNKAAAARAREIVEIVKGGVFVLVTSYSAIADVCEELYGAVEGVRVLKQGDKPRYKLLEEFKEHGNAVLVGTTSFWQGVDVPGRALRCVVIFKLPFAVPDDPLVEARTDLLRWQGRNAFLEYQVPQAIIMFRQGFGRLIRTKEDYGCVAVLDPRILRRHYGRAFLRSLPKCPVTTDLSEVARFFERWEGRAAHPSSRSL